ncbi:hypothetical protein ABEB36_006808 [Hypothenemus hampei]|uniref:Enoyl reductase (ER) domain-containing protein n=1 Tax=Hypothenemus hampei TaxID=57062 RepID=A0ABD1ERS8_HYPHA
MDEVIFKSSRNLEALQLQAGIATRKVKDLIKYCSEITHSLILQAWNSDRFEYLKSNFLELIGFLIEATQDLKSKIDPKLIWIQLRRLFGITWTKREIGIACVSFALGTFVGWAIAVTIRKQQNAVRYMEAVQINNYFGPEVATVVEDAQAPYECGDYDVLINVKAGSVQIVDAQICCGYGRTLRKILRGLDKQSELPVILGRDCTGIITDLGKKVNRLEIGDEVWVTVPYWSQGTLCQTILISEHRVARKPKNVGFEGACSLPYAGSLALTVLSQANIHSDNVPDKRFLIQDGCTPVGCVLIQLLKHWNAHITTTCFRRAIPVAKALGAKEIISIDEESNDESTSEIKTMFKELQLRGESYDVIIVTRQSFPQLDLNEFHEFIRKQGKVLSTIPSQLRSDSCNFFTKWLLKYYLRLKFLLENIANLSDVKTDYDEAHLCHMTLDRLTELVEEGILQTVVDKVFQPKDIEMALHYIQSPQSIGSSVVTFR